MRYTKITADRIFNGYKFLEDHVLILTGEEKVEAIVPKQDAGDEIEQHTGIITPGFINCHCHLELSHMKGLIPEKTELVDFVFKVVTERHHNEDEILEAIANAEDEMLKNGIVAVGDICNNALTLHQKEERRIHYYNFIEASGWLPSLAQVRFERAKATAEKFSILNSQFSISPHAPYSVSENLWKEIEPYFENKVVTIHNQETAFEDHFFLEGTGDFKRMYELMKIDNTHHQPTKKSSLQSYFHHLQKASSVLLVHNTFTKQSDIDFIQFKIQNSKFKITFCLCVNANQHIENALPPIELFRKNNCNIVLGTDSLASNWSLNILDEIKTIQKNFPSIPLEEILGWATINGAKALEMDDKLGSFEKGKKPGVNYLNHDPETGSGQVLGGLKRLI